MGRGEREGGGGGRERERERERERDGVEWVCEAESKVWEGKGREARGENNDTQCIYMYNDVCVPKHTCTYTTSNQKILCIPTPQSATITGEMDYT